MKSVAEDFFQRRDDNQCFVTGDGNVYRPRHEQLAREHARDNGLTVTMYKREDMKKKKTESKSASTSSKTSTKKGSTKKDS
jgi:hypothetical protein